MDALIIGFGEVGRAHWEVLRKTYCGTLYYKDKGPEIYSGGEVLPEGKLPVIDLLMIATQCDPADMFPFYDMVSEYYQMFKPRVIDILTTTPCGTTERLQEMYVSCPVCKSSTRGMHPNLSKFLTDIPKHIGGESADTLKDYYEAAGIPCITHKKGRAVELFHALNNFIYGINILAADECAKYCREFAVDYMEFLSYRQSNNDGFVKAGYPSKVSPILTPLNNNGVLGHCITYAPTTIPEDKRGPLAKMLAGYNATKGIGIKPGH